MGGSPGFKNCPKALYITKEIYFSANRICNELVMKKPR
ncbi:hypothetical protein GJA_1973 [Janthinobacterium agaricidamnosum NBRC 102515 = DSM 9628]|uniref:Uncharacterized protein n=1 Tax=Janthinobacterium agaricidamnosum NBRC 102515 = DSM 9628 TaxID=1349767 RepID=W0V1B3_9BURK|nr:hypothetical protein GJA_1973 [Janthinobacterium agaricidamnosum NBRC 102515 = DSM 9628]